MIAVSTKKKIAIALLLVFSVVVLTVVISYSGLLGGLMLGLMSFLGQLSLLALIIGGLMIVFPFLLGFKLARIIMRPITPGGRSHFVGFMWNLLYACFNAVFVGLLSMVLGYLLMQIPGTWLHSLYAYLSSQSNDYWTWVPNTLYYVVLFCSVCTSFIGYVFAVFYEFAVEEY
jgi:hypothetical protein